MLENPEQKNDEKVEEKKKIEVSYVRNYNKEEKVGVVGIVNIHKQDPDNAGYAMVTITIYDTNEIRLMDRIETALVHYNELGWSEYRPEPKKVQAAPLPETVPVAAPTDEVIYEDIPEPEKPEEHAYIVEGISHSITKTGKDCLKVWNSDAWFKTYGLTVMDWNLPSSIRSTYKTWELNKVYRPPKEMFAVITRKQGEFENAVGFCTEEEYRSRE